MSIEKSLTASPISKLNDDCLELIFKACDGCPFTLCTLTQVCRQWYIISQRPSVWRKLVINKSSLHAAYRRFLSSEYNSKRLQAVRSLTVIKPSESRHAHLQPLPFTYMTHITHLYTSNLCLAEIEYLSHQIVETKSKLDTLICKNIETWCNTRRFSSDMIQVHQHLRHVQFHFSQDGHSGFAPIHDKSKLIEGQEDQGESSTIKSFSLTSIRDDELTEQREILIWMEEVENDSDEVYFQEEIEQVDQRKRMLMELWHQTEQILIKKYQFFASLNGLERLEFGFCYTWTPTIWRDKFKKVIEASPSLNRLSLHGWDQLGKLEKMGSRSSTMQPSQVDAEAAIAECFELMPNLSSLQLVDFSVGPGLLKGGKRISETIQHIDIIFTRTFLRYFTEPAADVWLLLGPLKEFIVSAFSLVKSTTNAARTANIRLHPDLLNEVQRNPFFIEEPFLKSIQDSLQDTNVQVNLVHYYSI